VRQARAAKATLSGAVAVPVLGAGLVATVLGWKLARTSYPEDVRTICDAEARTHWTLARDSPALTDWIRDRMTTPDGNVLYSTLLDALPQERAERIMAAARAAGVAPCRIAHAYEDIAADADYRRDIQHVCSTAGLDAAVPDAGEGDAGAAADWRERKIEDIELWIETSAKSPKTQRLAAALRAAARGGQPVPADWLEGVQAALREAAQTASLPSCDLARAIAR
jgi:hypothetical protein